jgi:hypothetical protein
MGATFSSNADLQSLKAQVNKINSLLSNYQKVSTAALTPSSNIQVDYDILGSRLVNTSENIGKISSSLINNGSKLADAIVPGIVNNQSIISSIKDTIVKNNDFANSVSGVLTSNDNFKRILKGEQGVPGSLGGLESVKSNLYTSPLQGAKYGATVWCADDDTICKLPKGVETISVKHITGEDELYLLNKKGVIVGRHWGGNGNLAVQGDTSVGGILKAGNLHFTNSWASMPDVDKNASEISNDTKDYKALMLVGNKSGGVRKVGVWDRLEVHGNQSIDGDLRIGQWTIYQKADGNLEFKKDGSDRSVFITAAGEVKAYDVYARHYDHWL